MNLRTAGQVSDKAICLARNQCCDQFLIEPNFQSAETNNFEKWSALLLICQYLHPCTAGMYIVTGLWRFFVGTQVTTDDGRPIRTPVIQEFASV
ncbi:MAG: hypothetical protein KDE47_12125, partial [Caldilineaceae bacterium]|nr:hypothetical protein [Caldilineaceae bacterium]